MFARSPIRLQILKDIKVAVLEGANKVSEGLAEKCGSEGFDLVVV